MHLRINRNHLTAMALAIASLWSSTSQSQGSASTASLPPAPRYYVGIAPAEDRWISMPDGTRVYQGIEISYLLGQKLYESGKITPVMINDVPNLVFNQQRFATQNASGQSPQQGIPQTQEQTNRQNQIPAQWTSWLSQPVPMTSPTEIQSRALVQGQTNLNSLYAIKITPVVDTLLYSSGAKGDRFVYGFSPDHLNPYNQGRAGYPDNAYVANAEQASQCQKPDFFAGQFNPQGWGPFNTSFGVNFDEGFSFEIFGMGLTFKHKQYEIRDQIRFLIDNLETGSHQELVFQTKAKGSDVMISGAYDFISLGFDIQRRTTLIKALQNLLPQVIDNFIGQNFAGPWESTIVSVSGNIVTLDSGLNEEVTSGLQLITPDNTVFEVTTVAARTATLKKVSGSGSAYAGEVVQAYFGKPVTWPSVVMQATSSVNPNSPSTNSPAVNSQSRILAQASLQPTLQSTMASSSVAPAPQVVTTQALISMDPSTRAQDQKLAVAGCVEHKPGWLERLMDSLFIGYGFWRYENVFDQTTTPTVSKTPAVQGLRVALIDSGVDVSDSNIKKHLSFATDGRLEGFDFVSWDSRPGDDNGHGTAALKLILKNVKKPFNILPVKVIGPKGETSSSAIYDGFTFAVNSHVDAIVVPWSSIPSTLDAYTQGAALASAAQIPVFVAPDTVSGNAYIHTSLKGKKSYSTGGLDSRVKLPPEGVGTIQVFSNWINSL